mgnify:CR=1 FL=1
MNLYLYQTYATFLMVILFSWVPWILAVVVGFFYLYDTEHKYKASMRYYGIILFVLSLITGVLITILLPSKEAMKLFLGI